MPLFYYPNIFLVKQLPVQVAATPPNAVSLNSIGSPLPTLYIASTVSSNGIIFNIPDKQSSADIKAFATPIAFLH